MGQQTQVGTHATTVTHYDRGTVTVKYHQTTIVAANPQTGDLELNSGGWQTYTTKSRMNQFAAQYEMPFSVYQKNFNWYVQTPNGTFNFVDGMILEGVK
jgi:hypothetical protein